MCWEEGCVGRRGVLGGGVCWEEGCRVFTVYSMHPLVSLSPDLSETGDRQVKTLYSVKYC